MDYSFDRWIPAALINAAQEGTVIRVMLSGDDIAVWRGVDGHVRAWENRCPHRGMRLSYGIVRENRLTCLYHGWTYEGGGACALIPAHPDLDPPKTIKAKVYHVAEQAGMIWIAPETCCDAVPQVGGDWVPCRSLLVSGQKTTLTDLIDRAGLTDVLTVCQEAVLGDCPAANCRVLLAMQPTDKGTMMHCSVPGEAVDKSEVVSRWLIALRQQLEADQAA